MSAASFRDASSEVPGFLWDTRNKHFMKGCERRLRNPSDPQGSLLPAKTVNAVGPVRFLEFRSGVRPSFFATSLSADLATALGGFNIHSAAWVQATYKGSHGGFLGIGATDVYEVKFLRWCVQIYDVYDWNKNNITDIPVTDAQLKMIASAPFPPAAVTIKRTPFGINLVTMHDDYFRDLEVSGGGRAFLVRSETFGPPSGVADPFTIEI